MKGLECWLYGCPLAMLFDLVTLCDWTLLLVPRADSRMVGDQITTWDMAWDFFLTSFLLIELC